MDYSRSDLADRLAAEYALGSLRGPARRRFEALLPAHPALRRALEGWQARLMPLTLTVPPVEPPERVWAGVERALFGARAQSALPWWQRLAWWQSLTGVATTAALALGIALSLPSSQLPPVVVVMGAQTQPASFVASVSADGRSLVLKPLGNLQVDAKRALELWAVPVKGTPRSLGLVSGDRATTVWRTRLLDGTAAFAVSVEPPGGSPTGAPTGPIISAGKLQI